MKKMILLAFVMATISIIGSAQGCVAVRNISGFGQYNLLDNSYSTSDWYLNITSRYFKSYKDFRSTTQLKFPQDSIQTVRSFTTDFNVTHLLARGWSLSLSVPISMNKRTSKLEHGGISNPAHSTESFGIGDIRFTAYKWMLKPKINQKFNFQLGFGVKLPTGDYKYPDYFYRKEDSLVLAPVNPSIQLGDGGTGIITELNSFYVLNKTISFHTNFYYLLNPRDQNGTSNLLGRSPGSPSVINLVKAGGDVNSVPDQYTIRAGADFKVDRWLFAAGFRFEGVPVNDLLGESNGGRRAGYNASAEPGIVYSMRRVSIYSYVPIIVGRKVKQSNTDKKETELSGKEVYRQGGFADYLVFLGVQVKL